jgi:pimeloyl-ACP methyl ester carboxylesterase
MGPMDGESTPDVRLGRASLPSRGGDMAYVDLGPPDRPVDIIFSHANGYNGRTYRSILQPLAAELRIFALDLRGHGASTLPTVIEGRAGWTEFRDDLLAFLHAAVDHPVVLAGHSMGGTTSLLATAAEPERVRALGLFDAVLFDASHQAADLGDNPLAAGADRRRADFPSRQAVFEAYRGRGGFRTWSDAQLTDYIAAGFRETPDGVTLTCRPEWEASSFRIHRYDAWAAFRALTRPAVLLRAETASTARIEGHEAELAAAGVRVETIPGTTHFLPMERPDLVRGVLRELASS